MTSEFEQLFAVKDAEQEQDPSSGGGVWKVIIVDDDPDIHAVTKLALSDITYAGRQLQFFSATSRVEAMALLSQHSDCALILLDVVMEEEDSGLQLVSWIRDELANNYVRIILRTGHPNLAPERDIVQNYDINNYLTKSEVTAQRLFTSVIAALRSHENMVEVSREVSRVIINSAQVGIMVFDHQTRHVVEANPSARAMLGLEQEDIVGRPCTTFFAGKGSFGLDCLEDRRKGTSQLNMEMSLLAANRPPVPILLSAVPVMIRRKPYMVTTFIDISKRKVLEKRLEHLAYYDPLTQLPNRTLFHERFAEELADARHQREKLALLFIDLNDFKQVNDQHGHLTGDLLLQQVARRLQGVVRDSDCAARLSGDEFAVILRNPSSPQRVAEICERIIREVGLPYQLEGAACQVGSSIGISLYPEDGTELEDLLMQADTAMYRAKGEKVGLHGCYRFYSSRLSERSLEKTVDI